MKFLYKYWIVPVLIVFTITASAQKVSKSISLDTNFYVLDSFSIVPSSFQIYNQNSLVSDSVYELDYIHSTLIWKGDLPVNLQVKYVLLSVNFGKVHTKKDTALIQPVFNYKNPFKFTGNEKEELNLFGLDDLNKSGSISRGITVGNSQNLGVNSNFNLQLSGKIGGNINILASITDDNIPIQPDGNTQQLQDFDKVFIQLSEKNWEITAGDYNTESLESHYLRYRKKSKGMFFTTTFNLADSNSLRTNVGVAVSRGKYANKEFRGVEGNQGPYKLTGAENEQFILVLSGTEQVFVDGVLLSRGAENDYVIDYNTAEVTFTPSFLITKNKRVQVQFQYSDKNYLRSLAHAEAEYTTKKSTSTIRFYSEQDHKNQPLFQDLGDDEIALMASVGNQIENAYIQRENLVGEDENIVTYQKIDSLGYSIYLYSTEGDSSLYRLQFTNVGAGKGNYVLDGFSPFGKKYKWVKPDTVSGNLIQRGDYEPVVLLITPKKKQMLTFENSFYAKENLLIKTDLAFTNQDLNTFSDLETSNNYGLGAKVEVVNKKKLSNSLSLITGGGIDFTSIHFNPIEKFRTREFNRNWNLGNSEIISPILLANVNVELKKDSLGGVNYQLDVLDLGKDFRGIKNKLNVDVQSNSTLVQYSGSLLNSQSETNTLFYRHKSKVEYPIKKVVLGYSDEMENNEFKTDTLLPSSYSFYDGKVYVRNKKNTPAEYKLYYGYRNEKTAQNGNLSPSAFSHESGLDYQVTSKNKFTQLKGNVAYRKLVPVDTSTGLKPENTFLNQTNFRTSFLKQLISLNTFYSVGSGLEQKKEFLYLEVNPGQGVFSWIDYNDNGVKELNEFEVSIFTDQANYIRVFTQSNEYVRAYSNQFSQSITLNPNVILKNKEGNLWKFVSKISSVSALRINRKTTQESLESSLNPFSNNVADTNLISLNKQILSSLYFNRMGYKYGAELKVQNSSNKVLLSSGFDSRENTSYAVNLRYKVKQILLKWESEIGEKNLTSDYVSSRNYSIDYWETSPIITFQKGVDFNWEFVYSYKEKTNGNEGEFASLSTLGTTLKYTVANKLNAITSFNFVTIGYAGSNNSSLEYEMLEGLKRGRNFTWELTLNKRVAKNLDLSLQYNGRKPEAIKTIHAGSLQIRAFF